MLSQEKYRDPNPVVSYLIGRFFSRIDSLVREFAPRTVLDAGCGEGEVLRRRGLDPRIRAVCLDLQPASLAEVRSHSQPAGMVAGSVLAMPVAPASFDVVLCLEVLEHLDDPAKAVREVSRAAAHATIFSVPWEPYFRIGNVLRGKHLAEWGNHPEHIQHWNFASFEALLSGSFRRVRLVGAFPWIVACCLATDRLPG